MKIDIQKNVIEFLIDAAERERRIKNFEFIYFMSQRAEKETGTLFTCFYQSLFTRSNS